MAPNPLLLPGRLSPRRAAAWLRLARLLLAVAWGVAVPALSVQAQGPADAALEHLLDQGRAQPAVALKGIQVIIEASAPASRERVNALAVQGLVQAGASLRDTQAAAATADSLDRLAQALPDNGAKAAALLVRARMAFLASDGKAAEQLSSEALARLQADAGPVTRLRYVRAAAQHKGNAGKLEEAVRLWHEALKLADQAGIATRRADIRSELAFAYFQAAQPARAQSLVDEAIAIAAEAQDWNSLALAHNTAAVLADGKGDIPAQQHALQSALDYARKGGDRGSLALYLANMSNFYLATGDFRTAATRAEQALPLTRELDDVSGQIVALANLGLAHIGMKRIDAGKRWVEESLALEKARGQIAGQADIQFELGRALEKAGDPAGAVQAFHAYRRIADELFQRGNQKAILAVQEQFDAEQRNTRLELLERENRLKAEQLQHNALMQRLWLLLAAVLALSITVVALLYRRVRRINQALQASNQMLKVQGERDPLTGLANRRYFQHAMQTLAPGGKIVGTVCLIDVDHFKRINDSLGHAAGDAVLEEIARRLRSALRDDDMIVRWGGEEFLVVMQSLAAEAVDTLAQRMLDAIGGQLVQHEGRSIAVTASIGFATFPMAPARIDVGWERAIHLVDTVMYLAKTHGRNRAYGVKLLQARDEAGIDTVAAGLEAAWREGRVTLTLLRGHAAVVQPAPEVTA